MLDSRGAFSREACVRRLRAAEAVETGFTLISLIAVPLGI
jgi:hypothetical protein